MGWRCAKSHRQSRRRKKREILEGIRRGRVLKWRTVSMSVSPCLTIHSVTVGLMKCNTLFIPIEIQTQKNGKSIEKAMINSKAEGKFINQNFARNFKMNVQNLDEPLKALNMDGTKKKQGTIQQ